jgi:hypothetical protein
MSRVNTVRAHYIQEQRRWVLLVDSGDEKPLFHLEEDGTIWYVGGGAAAMANASERPIKLPGIRLLEGE